MEKSELLMQKSIKSRKNMVALDTKKNFTVSKKLN